MNTDFIGKAPNSDAASGISAAAFIVRSLLALLLCVLVWLCGRTSIMTERMHQLFRQFFTDSLPVELSGFMWQHPRMLLAFAVVIAAAGLAFLAFSKVQRRAVLVAGLAVVVLFGQWIIVTPRVYGVTVQTIQGVAEKVGAQ